MCSGGRVALGRKYISQRTINACAYARTVSVRIQVSETIDDILVAHVIVRLLPSPTPGSPDLFALLMTAPGLLCASRLTFVCSSKVSAWPSVEKISPPTPFGVEGSVFVTRGSLSRD